MIEQILHCQVYFIDNDTWINLVVIKFVKYLNRIYYSNIFFFSVNQWRRRFLLWQSDKVSYFSIFFIPYLLASTFF